MKSSKPERSTSSRFRRPTVSRGHVQGLGPADIEAIERFLRPHLKPPREGETEAQRDARVMGRVLQAITAYRGALKGGANEPLADRVDTDERLIRIGQLARELQRELLPVPRNEDSRNEDSEMEKRLRKAGFNVLRPRNITEDQPRTRSGDIYPPDAFSTAEDVLVRLALASELARRDLAAEERRGRPRDEAGHRLGLDLWSIWAEECRQRPLISRRNPEKPGPWVRFLEAVLRVVSASVKALTLAEALEDR